MIAKFLTKKFDQTMPVAILLFPHLLQGLRGGRIVGFESIGEVIINASVFFFQRDGQSENLLFTQTLEGTHG